MSYAGMQPEYAKFVSPSQVSVTFREDGASFSKPSTDPDFQRIVTLLAAGAPGWEVREAMDTVGALQDKMVEFGFVSVTRDGVLYKGRTINFTICDRIMEFHTAGEDVKYLLMFLDNLLKNPYKDSVESMYDFLERNEVPITPDGCFYAYKKVRHDYMDHHSGRFNNAIGQNPKVEGWEVDPDRNHECSKGLHVCARHYLPHFGGGNSHVMVVKVNPMHVYAVPRDYNMAKMRVTEYLVVGELTDAQKAEIFDRNHLIRPGQKIDGVKWDAAYNDNDPEPTAADIDAELEDYPDDEPGCEECGYDEDDCHCY